MEKIIFNEMIEMETNHWWYRAKKDIVSEVLDKYFQGQTNLQILDIGCGTGSYLKLLKQFGNALGLEPNKSMAEHCRKRGFRIVNYQIENYQSKQKFDLITAFDVLEHIQDDQKAIKKFASLLESGGQLLITVPAFKGLWSRHDQVCHHYRRYKARDVDNLVQDEFKLIYISYYNFFLSPFIFVGLKFKYFLKSDQLPAKLPNKLINWLLYKVFSSEKKIIARGKKMPFGVSLIVLAQKR